VTEVAGDQAAQGSLRSMGLTRRELRLVDLLLDGLPLKRAASEMGVSYNTARLHLARAMQKSGTHRQVDLVRLALGSR
jgi:DNA-binding CsgD family transcriptional regulator